ncbi:hypothetical protein Lal_00003021 [Lupinus albus]|uniref:Uncharacterized protein n=1 Tax=Lupinus albus TaxID=3870 RepID=A0A6A5NIU0_LUPAL|nr:hypothetical protein Lalb_Chr22g0356321 [Lupinus albus]KAF1882840.1 hypothetical protein Lal_00003021 [Lupinus albus]
MCATRGTLVVATTVGVVEALKDQGYCRLNNTMRSITQHAKNQIGSVTRVKKLSSSTSSSAISKKVRDDEKMKKKEEALRMVVYLSLWGPNS